MIDDSYRRIPSVSINRYKALCGQMNLLSLQGKEVVWLESVVARHDHEDLLNRINPIDQLSAPYFSLDNGYSWFARICPSRSVKALLSLISSIALIMGFVLFIIPTVSSCGMAFLASACSLLVIGRIIAGVCKIKDIVKQLNSIHSHLKEMSLENDWSTGWLRMHRGGDATFRGWYQAIYADLIEATKNIGGAARLDLFKETRVTFFCLLLLAALLTAVVIGGLMISGAALPFMLISTGYIGLGISFGLVTILTFPEVQSSVKKVYAVIRFLCHCPKNEYRNDAIYKASVAMVHLVKSRKMFHQYIVDSASVPDPALTSGGHTSLESSEERVDQQIVLTALRNETRMLRECYALIPPPSYEEANKCLPPAYTTANRRPIFKAKGVLNAPPDYCSESFCKGLLLIDSSSESPLGPINLSNSLPLYSEKVPLGHYQVVSLDAEVLDSDLGDQ